MAGKASTNIVLSNLGAFVMALPLTEFTDVPTELPGGATKLNDVLSISGLGVTRNSVAYTPLDGNGYPKKALLNFDTPDMILDCVRTESGPNLDDSTFHYFKTQSQKYKADEAWIGLIIARPVGDGYEADYYAVAVGEFDYTVDPGVGQEYTVSLIRTGPLVELKVTEGVGGEMTYALKA